MVCGEEGQYGVIDGEVVCEDGRLGGGRGGLKELAAAHLTREEEGECDVGRLYVK